MNSELYAAAHLAVDDIICLAVLGLDIELQAFDGGGAVSLGDENGLRLFHSVGDVPLVFAELHINLLDFFDAGLRRFFGGFLGGLRSGSGIFFGSRHNGDISFNVFKS